MMHFRSQAPSSTPKLEMMPNTDQEELGSVISSYQSGIWINPCPSSLGILLDEKGLEASEMDTLRVHHQEIGNIEEWGTLDGSRAAHECRINISNNPVVNTDSSDPLDELGILDALVKKYSQQQDSAVTVDPSGSFLPVTRSNITFQSFQIEARSRDVSDTHKECIENRPKSGLAAKVAAKRSGRPLQVRPPKRFAGACQHFGGAREISQREIHIQSERQRRKGMNHLFDTMRSLLPNPIQKADKSTIVSEIINYIQSLQQNLQDLNKKREKLLSSPTEILRAKSEPRPAESFQSECTGANSPVSSTISSNDECTRQTSHFTVHFHGSHIFITISCVKRANLLAAIIFVLEDCNLQVVNANVSTTDTMAFHCLHVKALETPDLIAREALKCALQRFLSSDCQICFER